MTRLFEFTEHHPFVILILILFFLFILGFRKYVYEFLSNHLFTTIIILLLLITLGLIIPEEIESRKEHAREALIESACNDLYNIIDEYDYKDSEIPSVSIYAFIANASVQDLSIYVRFYDKFDNYPEEQQLLLVHEYNQFFVNEISDIITNSEYYTYLEDNSSHVTIYYDTNDNQYDEYQYEHTLEFDLSIPIHKTE